MVDLRKASYLMRESAARVSFAEMSSSLCFQNFSGVLCSFMEGFDRPLFQWSYYLKPLCSLFLVKILLLVTFFQYHTASVSSMPMKDLNVFFLMWIHFCASVAHLQYRQCSASSQICFAHKLYRQGNCSNRWLKSLRTSGEQNSFICTLDSKDLPTTLSCEVFSSKAD